MGGKESGYNPYYIVCYTMSMEPEIQAKNTQSKVDRIAPYMWKKGQSGNVLGRPKGKTMKEWAKEYLERMTDEERDEFMEGIPKEMIWKMSEGNPKQDIGGEIKGEIVVKLVKYGDNTAL